MRRLVLNACLWVCALAVFPVISACKPAPPSPPSTQEQPNPVTEAPETILARIYHDYSSGRDKRDIEALVRLDQELRTLPFERLSKFLKPDYESIGLAPGLFEKEWFDYSGKLLVEAHAINPNSQYRPYTLWATAIRPENEATPRDAVEAYLREFPSGPFTSDAYLALATFYDDLYKVIKLEQEDRRIDYKYDCFKSYLKGTPLDEQARAAREAGIQYYQKLLQLKPSDEFLASQLATLREGKDDSSWSNCPD